MTEGIWVAIITQGVAFLLAVVGMWGKLGRIDKQTTNSHQETDYPNLRDEITSVRETVEATAEITRGHDKKLERIDRNLADLHETDENTGETISRHRKATSRALAMAVMERDYTIAEQEHRLRQHLESRVPELIREHIENGVYRGQRPPDYHGQ